MELENSDFLAMIYYDLKRGLTYHESHKKKTSVKLLGPLPQENRLLAIGFGSLDFVEVILMITVVADLFCCHPRECCPC